ncbi:MAG TPA: alpha/beta fold hydrolase [Burkholderiaceae bacterium]|nr:alpha/beta fold hydrolase [Burkholderiaceae bacterium]
MIARITRILLLLQLAAVLALAALAAQVWQWSNAAALVFACSMLYLLRLAITANNFYLAARYRAAIPAAFRLDWRDWRRLFWQEFDATLLASSWSMPFRRFRQRPAVTPRGPAVLLVHGYGCNSGYWDGMSRVLARTHISHHALDLEPVLGSIDQYVPALDAAIQALCKASGQARIVLVAHSMGGLAARAYLRRHGAARIAKIITLGTPHHGTALANFAIGVNTREMHWNGRAGQGQPSAWLQALAASEDAELHRLFVSIYSHHDNIVSPPTSAHLDGARNIELAGIGHVALGVDAGVQKLVLDEILATTSTEPVAMLAVNPAHPLGQ